MISRDALVGISISFRYNMIQYVIGEIKFKVLQCGSSGWKGGIDRLFWHELDVR